VPILGSRCRKRSTQPCLSQCICRPGQIDATGAKHPLAAVGRFAGNAFQYDGRRPAKPLHFIQVSLMRLPSKKAKRLF
jgi:hypothetical protein